MLLLCWFGVCLVGVLSGYFIGCLLWVCLVAAVLLFDIGFTLGCSTWV